MWILVGLVLVVVVAFAIHPVAGLVALGLVGWLVVKAWKAAPPAESTAHGTPAVAQRATRSKKGEHQPPPPQGELLEAWSTRTTSFEVAGEFYRRASFEALFAGQPIRSEGGAELLEPAVLVPDPANPFDPNAVAVYVRGHHVGYLERADAAGQHARLAELARGSRLLEVESRQWARYDTYRKKLFARVTVRIPDADGIVPVNEVPDGAVVLPRGGAMQVTREDEHMDTIAPWLNPSGAVVDLAVTLHAVVDVRPRSTVEVVEVQVDGKPAGVLSPTQTANLLPLVKHVAALGRPVVARAVLKGNALKADITLYVSKAQDVDPVWLSDIGSQGLA